MDIIRVLTFLVASQVASGGPAEEPDDRVVNQVSRLPARIQEPGVYRLASDLAYHEPTGQAISIEADHVTLDLNGRTLSGSAGAATLARGIYANDHAHITITNGRIRGFYFGIDLRRAAATVKATRKAPRSHSHVVSEVQLEHNWYFGVRVMGSACEIRDCEIVDTGGSTRPGHTIPHAARLVGAGNAMRDCIIRGLRLSRFPDGKGEIVGVHFDAARDALFERNQVVEHQDKDDAAADADDVTERRFGLWINGGAANDTTLAVRNNTFVGFTIPIVFAPGADGSATGNTFHNATKKPIRGKPNGRVAGNRSLESRPVEIGSRRELFVDRLLIDRMQRMEFKLHHPVPAPRPKSPLPERHMMTVIQDGERLKAWYRGSDPAYTGKLFTGHPGETVHYAESRYGHEWRFPKLRLHEIGGTQDNNVVLAKQPPFLTNFIPFLDQRPGVDPTERFKALAGHPGPGDKRGLKESGRGLFAFVSPDGFHWTKKKEVIPYQPEWRHAFDSPNVSFWSETEQQYICYFRTWTDPERLRSISRTTSLDFENWTKPIAMDPNRPGEHLYTNGTQPYFRAPHIYIALPTRFVPGRGDAPEYNQKDRNATDILFMSTRAGSTKYERIFTEAFIRPGLDQTRWRNRANYVALNVIPTSPVEMSIYHRSGDRYVLRTDGFISVNAGSEQGELLTRPITFSGRELNLNASTSAAGGLRVEIQESDGTPIPGFNLEDCALVYGDEIDRTVSWRDGALKSLAGRPIRLRFVMRECDLYSLRFQ